MSLSRSIRNCLAGAVVAAVTALGSATASAGLVGDEINGCWGHFNSFGCFGQPTPFLNLFTGGASLATATVGGGTEFSATVLDFTLDADVSDDEVTVTITNHTGSPGFLIVDQIVLLSNLDWPGDRSIASFDVTGGTFSDVITFFGNDDPNHGNFVGLLLPPRTFGTDPGIIPAFGSLFVTAEIELVPQVPEPATLALFGAGLAGLGWTRRKRAA